MLRIRSTAMLAGLVPVVALGTGTFSVPAAARPVAASLTRPAALKLRPAGTNNGRVFSMPISQHYGVASNASGYSVLVLTGDRQGWAFGGSNPGGVSKPVAEHWTSAGATASSLPARLGGFISDASAPGPRDIWATSQYGRYVLHWNGTRWRVAKRWRSGQITGMAAVSARDTWVFGTAADGSSGVGTWHFNGRRWLHVRGEAGSIYRASARSGRDIWALAASPKADTVLRYNGRSWHRIRTGRALAGVQPRDILAASARSVWVLGNQISRAGTVRLVLAHWNGSRWTRRLAAVHAWAGRLAAGPDGTVLIAATPADASATGLILVASAHGWRTVLTVKSGLGSGVSDVAARKGSLWASGGILTRLGGDAAIWHDRAAPRHRDDDD